MQSVFVKPGMHQPQAGTWFLRIASVHECLYVCMCVCALVCVSAPEAINKQWRDIDPYDWLNTFYGFYMAAVVNIFSGHGISIHMRCGNYSNKSKLVLYKPFLHCNNHLKQL